MKWEYRVERVETWCQYGGHKEGFITSLNEAGAGGWELVSVVPVRDSALQGTRWYDLFYKRQVKAAKR